jgi:16S rRNA (guanine966-N2)-methyltransferase
MGNGKQGQLRIIAGQWRGRKLRFPDVEGLRPTPDRVRETLFNWLAADLPDADCLDLFCGSGALGLEALSRGARHCTFVDSSARAIASVEAHLQTLQCRDARCIPGPAESFLSGAGREQAFDIVFLDPPYGAGLLTGIAQSLESGQWLRSQALVYVESSAAGAQPELPASWQLQKEKTAGDVRYQLFVRLREFV